jgi:ribonuclease T1
MTFRSSLTHALVACCLVIAAASAAARGTIGQVPPSELPRDAATTLELIARDGPFPYDRDGVTFGNREHALPDRPRGYYREYTVRTPGVRSRGARRIVCGGPPRSTSDCYYSDDHYRTFKRIR